METLILLVASLFMTSPSTDSATMTTSESSYTTTYDPATGSTITSDGSIIVIDPSETN